MIQETTTDYSVDGGLKALITKVTDALGNEQSTYTNGSGKTVKSVQHSGPDGEITTTFEYDGIQRLVKVTDTEGNQTLSTYDMGDRRTEVNHPAKRNHIVHPRCSRQRADQADREHG